MLARKYPLDGSVVISAGTARVSGILTEPGPRPPDVLYGLTYQTEANQTAAEASAEFAKWRYNVKLFER